MLEHEEENKKDDSLANDTKNVSKGQGEINKDGISQKSTDETSEKCDEDDNEEEEQSNEIRVEEGTCLIY